MQAVILAGGFGTRISEETTVRPKPMIKIGPEPILWHIMKLYSVHGINDFIICCGYKGAMIKRFFAEYRLDNSDVTFDLRTEQVEVHRCHVEPWRVTCVDTGSATMTGGRLRRIRDYLDDGPFCLTYGDGVADINIQDSIAFHRSHGKLATLTAVQPAGRFGAFSLEGSHTTVESFTEKPQGMGAWVNGGFFVLDPEVIDYIEDDSTVWERGPIERLAAEGNLQAYKHHGFWQPMDTLRDKMYLEAMWNENRAPWKLWKDEPPVIHGVHPHRSGSRKSQASSTSQKRKAI